MNISLVIHRGESKKRDMSKGKSKGWLNDVNYTNILYL